MYVNAPCHNMVHIYLDKYLLGPKNKGNQAIIVRGLHHIKSSSKSWSQNFSLRLRDELGYLLYRTNLDVHMKEKTKLDGLK